MIIPLAHLYKRFADSVGEYRRRLLAHVLRKRKHALVYLVTRSVRTGHSISIFLVRLFDWIKCGAISLSGFLIAGVILLDPRLRPDAFGDVFLELGTLFGTILALVFTLSLIPVQRAAEVWSLSILLLYRREPVAYLLTFITLGVFCLLSFAVSISDGFLGVPVSIVLAGALVLLAISFDLLRWYYRHICHVLTPTYALQSSLKVGKREIDRMKASTTRAARVEHRLMRVQQPGRMT